MRRITSVAGNATRPCAPRVGSPRTPAKTALRTRRSWWCASWPGLSIGRPARGARRSSSCTKAVTTSLAGAALSSATSAPFRGRSAPAPSGMRFGCSALLSCGSSSRLGIAYKSIFRCIKSVCDGWRTCFAKAMIVVHIAGGKKWVVRGARNVASPCLIIFWYEPYASRRRGLIY